MVAVGVMEEYLYTRVDSVMEVRREHVKEVVHQLERRAVRKRPDGSYCEVDT
jgi:hypothetical protein